MTYKSYFFSIILRILLLAGSLFLVTYGILENRPYVLVGGSLLSLVITINLYRFLVRRFKEMDDFFESVKYRDFSRFFVEQKGPQDIRELHKGFNNVNRTIRAMNSERQMQFVYLQKILEMVEVGILAYNIKDGVVLWTNDSFLQLLDFPAFKNINFIEGRRPEVYRELFQKNHDIPETVKLDLHSEQLKVLLSDTVFAMENDSFKLIVIQNIEKTLDKNESDAWKKLLSVMTHEIMNSIAPIASLAQTLQNHIQEALVERNPQDLELEDLNDGLKSIKKRSEGLMKFAKTYRSLNKVTQLSLSQVRVENLLNNIKNLMQPSLNEKKVNLFIELQNNELSLNIDSYLIEQVLINLILNAIEASSSKHNPEIIISAKKNLRGNTSISVKDNGSGIPKDLMESIFVPFFTTKKTGSGVGLSLCKQIMSLHQGTVQVQETSVEGTKIALVF